MNRPIPESWMRFAARWLAVDGGPAPELAWLPGGGSRRAFLRVRLGRVPAVLMVNPDPPADQRGVDENDTYVYLAGLLREIGAGPPEVFAFDREQGLVLMEDLGDRRLLEEVAARGPGSAWTRGIYQRLLELLSVLQLEGGRRFDPQRGFNPPYEAGFMLRAEGLYFARQFASRAWGAAPEGLEQELERLAEMAGSLLGEPLLLYRDFQSSNIMLGEEDHLRLVDFQGARLGPPAYDLASLVLDPYVALPAPLREELIEGYFALVARKAPSTGRELRLQFPLVAAHRLLQVLGAYAKLAAVDRKPQFLDYVPPALERLSGLLKGAAFDSFPLLRRSVLDLPPAMAQGRLPL